MEIKKYRNGVEIRGDYSFRSVYLTDEAFNMLGGTEEAFHQVMRWRNAYLMPREGHHRLPIRARDIELTRENERLGFKKWDYDSKTRGRWQFRGYYYTDGNYAVFPDLNERVLVN